MVYREMGFNQPGEMKIRLITKRFVIIIIIVIILSGLYLGYACGKYRYIAEKEALQLVNSVEAFLPESQIYDLSLSIKDSQETKATSMDFIEQSLSRFVETTESIYYAYILKKQDGDIFV